jgi:hypothetical protein
MKKNAAMANAYKRYGGAMAKTIVATSQTRTNVVSSNHFANDFSFILFQE